CGRLRWEEIGAGAVDQKPAQIWFAALGYPARAMFAAGGILPWHQTQPGRELAPTAEAARFYHRGGDGCGDDRADARNARQALADGVALVPGHELLLDRSPPPAAQSVRPAPVALGAPSPAAARRPHRGQWRPPCRRRASPAARSRQTKPDPRTKRSPAPSAGAPAAPGHGAAARQLAGQPS